MRLFVFMVMALLTSGCVTRHSAMAPPVAAGATVSNVSNFAAHVRPLLRRSGKAARVYYRAVCSVGNGGLAELSFPTISLHAPARGKTGIGALRDMLPNDAAVEERGGIVSIRLGNAPRSLLDTRIGTLAFTPEEQFNAPMAIMAISRSHDVREAAQRMGYELPIEDISILVARPAENLPHLPPRLSDMSLDQIYDEVAKTFGTAVFFGACEDRRLYLAQSHW